MGARIHGSVLDLVGDTPLVELRRIPRQGARVIVKVEAKNPSGSVKDRPALAMVLAAEESGLLAEGSAIVEATSGNTGIALAMIAAVRGYRCILVMPEDMSVERRRILRAYGAEIVITAADEGMAGALAEAEAIVARTESNGCFIRKRIDLTVVCCRRESCLESGLHRPVNANCNERARVRNRTKRRENDNAGTHRLL